MRIRIRGGVIRVHVGETVKRAAIRVTTEKQATEGQTALHTNSH
jgi:hypothetical protein